MAKNTPQQGFENREVGLNPTKLPKQPRTRSPIISRNAAFFAAALAAAGCSMDGDSNDRQENLGQAQQALSSEAQWDDPSLTPAMAWATPPMGYSNGAPNVTINGSTVDVFFQSTRPGGSGSSDIWIAESMDGGQTWPTVQPVAPSGVAPALNTSSIEVAPIVFSGGTKIALTSGTKMELCDLDLAAKQAGNCQSVGTNINKFGHSVFPLAVNNGILYYSDQNGANGDDIFSTPIGPLPLAVGTPVSSLNSTPGNDDGVSFNANYGILTTTGQPGNLGGYDLFAFDWNDVTKTATNITNVNAIIGSFGNINDAGNQGSGFIDAAGNLWWESNGVIYKAQKKASSGTGGSGGGAGSSGSSGSSGSTSGSSGSTSTGGMGGAGSSGSSGSGGIGGMGGAGSSGGSGGIGGMSGSSSTGGMGGMGGMSGSGGAGGSMETGGTTSSSGSSGTSSSSGAGGSGPGECRTTVVDKMDSAECKVDCSSQSVIETVTLKDGSCALKYTDDTGYTLMTLSNGDFAKGKELYLGINGDGTGSPTAGLSFDQVEDHGSGFHLQQEGFEAGPLGTGYRWQYTNDHTVKASVVYDTVLFKINGLPVEIPNTALTNGKITGDQKASDPDKWNHSDTDPSITVDLNTLAIINSTFKPGSNFPGNKPPETGGCSCSDVSNSTTHDLNALFMAAGLIGIMALRRKKGFVGIESNQEKA